MRGVTRDKSSLSVVAAVTNSVIRKRVKPWFSGFRSSSQNRAASTRTVSTVPPVLSFGAVAGEASKGFSRPQKPQSQGRELFPGLPTDVALQILLRLDRKSLSAARDVSRFWRSLVESTEFYESRKKASYAEDWVYVVGQVVGKEHPQLLVFDPKTMQHRHLASLPPKSLLSSLKLSGKHVQMQRHDFGLVAVGTELVMFGACAPSKFFGKRSGGVWRYNVLSNQWRRAADMSTFRSGFAVGALDGKVYVVGGRNHEGLAMTSGEAYDLHSDRWEPMPHMRAAKHICTGAVMEGKLYVLGCGDQWRCQPQDLLQPVKVEVFDPAVNAWSTLAADCPAPKVWGVPWHDQAMPVAVDRCMYWVGCGALKLRFYDSQANAFVGYFENEICALDEASGEVGYLHGPPGGSLQARESCGLAVAGGQLLVLGGCQFDQVGKPSVYPKDVLVYSPKGPSGGSWQALSLAERSVRLGKVWKGVTLSL